MAEATHQVPLEEAALAELEHVVSRIGDLLPHLTSAIDALEAQASGTGSEAFDETTAALDTLEELAADFDRSTDSWAEMLWTSADQVAMAAEEFVSQANEVASQVQAGSDAATAAFESLEADLGHELQETLAQGESLLDGTTAAIESLLDSTSAAIGHLHEIASATRLADVSKAATTALETLDSTLNRIEEGGVRTIEKVTSSITDIADKLDKIVASVAAIKPALDAVAAVA